MNTTGIYRYLQMHAEADKAKEARDLAVQGPLTAMAFAVCSRPSQTLWDTLRSGEKG